MQEGPRNTQSTLLTPAHPQDNVFLLRRATNPHPNTSLRVAFSSPKTPPASPFSSIPVFNRDGRYYTPAFILPEDKPKFENNSEICLISHLQKVKEHSEEKSQLLIPKPSQANRFCMVCRKPFEDYLSHITESAHLALLRQSDFYGDILDLCQRIGPTEYPKPKKQIRKQAKAASPKPSLKKGLRGRKSQEAASTTLPSEGLLVGSQ